MLDRKRIRIAALLALIIASSSSFYAFAGFSDMEGSGSPARSGGPGGINTNKANCDLSDSRYSAWNTQGYKNINLLECSGWSWIYFKYVGTTKTGMYYAPNYSTNISIHSTTPGHTDGVWIPDECAEEGRGFYHLGRNWETEGTVGTYGLSKFVSTRHYLMHRETYTKQFLRDIWVGGDADGGWLEKTDSYAGTGSPLQVNAGSLKQDLYYNNELMYQADHYELDSRVREIYKSERGTEMSDNVWGFCAYGGKETKKQTYEAEVELKIDYAANDITATSETDIDITKDDDETHKVTSGTITFRGFGKVTAQDADSEQQDTSYTVTERVTDFSQYEDSEDYTVNDTLNGPDSITVELVPGRVYEICAINDYSPSYDNSNNPAFAEKVRIKACTKVYYEIDCNDFGVKITPGNRLNYGRMEMNVGAQFVAVGDGSNNNRLADQTTTWATPETEVTTKYLGCMGSQAARDAGKGGTTEYRTSSDMNDETYKIYKETKNYVDLESAGSIRNYISSDELGLGWPDLKNGNSDTNKRIAVGYQFNNVTANQVSNLAPGKKYKNAYAWERDGYNDAGTVDTSITVNVPYNYVLNPTLSASMERKLTIGDVYSLEASAVIEPRFNNEIGSEYVTTIKPNTIARAWMFTMDSDMEATVFRDLQAVSGDTNDFWYEGDSDSNPIEKLGGIDVGESIDLNANGGIKTLEHVVTNHEAIGTKVCALVAVWPADSHNTLQGAVGGAGDSQENALQRGAGSNPKWRFSIDCATVGKSPTISVEGGSIVANGEVRTTSKTYNHHTFGSWSEYGLIANNVSGFTGSGASLAYAITNPQRLGDEINSEGDTSSDGFFNDMSGRVKNPQTNGNLNPSTYGGVINASPYFNLSSEFADSIVSTFYDYDGDLIDTSRYNYGSLGAGKTGFMFYKNKTGQVVEIKDNIYNDSQDAILVIVGKRIEISNDVDRIDAVLIADETIDTCSEAKQGRTADDKVDTGNQWLFEKCSNSLIINGAVYVGNANGEADPIKLDRVYGSGTEDEENLDSSKLALRAEIFNYDPRIVKLSYEFMKARDSLSESYVKELTPRY